MRPLLNGGTLGRGVMRFHLPDHVFHALQQAQPDRLGDPLLREYDAFMLDPGWAPLSYSPLTVAFLRMGRVGMAPRSRKRPMTPHSGHRHWF